MNFSEYLISKKIDERAFAAAEPDVFRGWQTEFGQMHANSFTVQKLNLINPIRRKYPLKEIGIAGPSATPQTSEAPAASAPKASKPVFKPKLKS